MNLEFFFILFFFFFVFFLIIFLYMVFFISVFRYFIFDKLSSYECGFNPFEDIFGRFDIRFYVVAILFLIFDLEVTFIFPWVLNIFIFHFFSFFLFFIFFFVLALGLFYEFRRGALEWR